MEALGEFKVWRDFGRINIEAISDYDYDEAINRLTKIFKQCIQSVCGKF